MRLRSVVIAGAVSLAMIACSGGGGDGGPTSPTGNNPTPNNPAPTESNNITVTDNTYTPGTKTISSGATVTWQWAGCTGGGYGGGYGGDLCAAHSVTFDDGTSSPTQSDGTYARTFAAKGTYKYHCKTHGTAMSGTITVQ
ncbi:MAG TPA: plastocyanin/azurin family copper-binding protein [Gemmatimonadaceae bacterium]